MIGILNRTLNVDDTLLKRHKECFGVSMSKERLENYIRNRDERELSFSEILSNHSDSELVDMIECGMRVEIKAATIPADQWNYLAIDPTIGEPDRSRLIMMYEGLNDKL